mmetsp:Transcript_13752/g.32314  ORF Transcript_13752/g.32314 Transcript_13752/m.32314 type:complete len:437 (+) Transcript_13752:67-1377(+)
MGEQRGTRRRALTEEMVFMRTKSNRLDLIKNLNLWGNDLHDISVLQLMPNLEVLSLSVNRVSSLADLGHCSKLSELYLRKNDICDLADVRHLKSLRNLQVLWLSDNPCATLPHYRVYVLQQLPQLKKLDAQDVTPAERRQAADADVRHLTTRVECSSEDEAPPAHHPHLERANTEGWGGACMTEREYTSNRRPSDALDRMVPSRSDGRRHTAPENQFPVRRREAYTPSNGMEDRTPQPTPRMMEPPDVGSPTEIHGDYTPYADQSYSTMVDQFHIQGHLEGPNDMPPLDGRGMMERDNPRPAWVLPSPGSPDTPARRSNGSTASHMAREREARQRRDGRIPRESGDPRMDHRADAWDPRDARDPRDHRDPRYDPREAMRMDMHGDMRGDYKGDPGPDVSGRADNILCAVLALIKELDQQGLELVRRAIEQRQGELS